MRYIETSFFDTPKDVSVEFTRIYLARDCFDSYLHHIIEPHRVELEGVNLGSKYIYILTENKNKVNIEETYCSLSFIVTKRKIQEDNKQREINIYTPCIVTCDNLNNKKECLSYLFSQVLTQISSSDTRMSIGPTTLGIFTNEHIKEGVDMLLNSIFTTDNL